MKIGILLITYKRKEFLDSILSKIEELSLPTILYQNLSLENSEKHNEVKSLLQKHISKSSNFRYINPPKSLNAKNSIIFAINYAANLFDFLLIIEDDICINNLKRNIIFEAIELLNRRVASISLYSPFVLRTNMHDDYYILLRSFYGHSWGWILNSNIWKEFQSEKEYKISRSSKNFINFNFEYRKFAYHSLSSLSRKGIIDTWDYSWNLYCQSKNLFHYKFVPSITKHLGNRDKYATNSRNSMQNDSIKIELSKNKNFKYKNKFLIFTDKNFDIDLLRYHHNLSFLRSLIIIIFDILPLPLISKIFSFYRKLTK